MYNFVKAFIITQINDYSAGDKIVLNTKMLLLKNAWGRNSWIF